MLTFWCIIQTSKLLWQMFGREKCGGKFGQPIFLWQIFSGQKFSGEFGYWHWLEDMLIQPMLLVTVVC